MVIRCALTGFVVFCWKLTFCQEADWPIKYATRYEQIAQIIKGEIITKNNDTLKGYIKEIEYLYPILPFGKEKVIQIELSRIKNIRLFGHSVLSNGVVTEITNLGQNNFWRLLIGDSTTAIYDNVLSAPTFVYGGKMIIMSHGKKKKLYSSFSYLFHNGNISPLLRRYIRQNWGSRYVVDARCSSEEILYKILDFESNKKLQ